jgi:hypothetical protein
MRKLALLLLLIGAGCDSPVIVVTQRLEPGGGGTDTTNAPVLDIVVRMSNNASGFFPVDLMRVVVNGVNHTDEVVMGGTYALLRLDPAPVGTNFVELSQRTGPVIDTFTWQVLPFPGGPTLASVAPNTAQVGTDVTITGSGFSSGPLRVFFGGFEGAVQASTDTSITATVPAEAVPGLIYVLVGSDAAVGIVEFQPLDAGGSPVAAPLGISLYAAFPARGSVGSVVTVYGLNFDGSGHARFNGVNTDVFVNVETTDLPLIGAVTSAFCVINHGTDPAASEVTLLTTGDGSQSNPLPFLVE